MSQLYKKIENYNLVKNVELFGVTDRLWEQLLPCEYDSIFYEEADLKIKQISNKIGCKNPNTVAFFKKSR